MIDPVLRRQVAEQAAAPRHAQSTKDRGKLVCHRPGRRAAPSRDLQVFFAFDQTANHLIFGRRQQRREASVRARHAEYAQPWPHVRQLGEAARCAFVVGSIRARAGYQQRVKASEAGGDPDLLESELPDGRDGRRRDAETCRERLRILSAQKALEHFRPALRERRASFGFELPIENHVTAVGVEERVLNACPAIAQRSPEVHEWHDLAGASLREDG